MKKIFLTFLFLSSLAWAAIISAQENTSSSIRIGLTGVIVQENLTLNEHLLKFIEKKLGIPVEMVMRDTYKEINDMMEKRELDIAFTCSPPYIMGHNSFSAELLVVPQINGKPMYYSYTIVHADSPAKSFEDLRGKRYAYSDPLSNSGFLAPSYRLAQMGETPESFFKKHVYTRSHYNSIEAVAMKVVDGASVDSYVWHLTYTTNPELISKTRILEKGDLYPFTPFTIRSDIAINLMKKII
ncbi:MAG: phosphate/phosphite/phosphonate ABC transporter substrate-binding protein [Nitrospinae bacterium]|nr:phosphate/phosphite/phosphonate ABC transporter substrate-binding protein [Nitrospinota bacterium]